MAVQNARMRQSRRRRPRPNPSSGSRRRTTPAQRWLRQRQRPTRTGSATSALSAETDNVRKRAARDVENAHKFALERFGKELLAVNDGLEMALAASENATVESLLEGSRCDPEAAGHDHGALRD